MTQKGQGHMKYAMIGTWEMAIDGVTPAGALLARGGRAADAVELAAATIEDNPLHDTVGYGGLPNREGLVELDAAFMDGDDLMFGAVMGVKNIKNPIKVARRLSRERLDCQLVGPGAERFAEEQGFAFQNMLTEPSRQKWLADREKYAGPVGGLESKGHDTVGFIGLDRGGHMAVGVSTSGLFLKRAGRVGDSPIIGSGYYCDSAIGGAAATGVGEYIMRGCLCYEAVQLMRELSPADACARAVGALAARLSALGYPPQPFSVIALNKDGAIGAASTWDVFPFAVCDRDGQAKGLSLVRENGTARIRGLDT
jgi:N4-(beta-N-acetylglucosaminyl)-L-asparaginase